MISSNNSMHRDINSLMCRKKFPDVLTRISFVTHRKDSSYRGYFFHFGARYDKIPCKLPDKQRSCDRDLLAVDCQHHHDFKWLQAICSSYFFDCNGLTFEIGILQAMSRVRTTPRSTYYKYGCPSSYLLDGNSLWY